MVTRKLPDAVNLDAYEEINPQVEQADWEAQPSYPADLDSTEYSRRGWRRSTSLAPEPVADPPPDLRRSNLTASLSRMAIVAALVMGAGVAAYTLVEFDASRQEAGIDTSGARAPAGAQERSFEQRAGLPLPRLSIAGSRNASGQAASLGISLQGAVPSAATVVVAGLPEKATVSAGERFGANAWLVPAARVAGATVQPRENFVGVVDLVVEIVMPDGTTADRGVTRLEWLATPPVNTVRTVAVRPPAAPAPAPSVAPPVVASAPAATPAAPPVMAAAPASPAVSPAMTDTPQAPPAARRQAAPQAAAAAPTRALADDEIAVLLKRAEAFLSARDVAAARVMLRRAAEAGSAEGAFALATTYDQSVLQSLGVIGIQGEPETARLWYERAAQYGSADARTRLREIAQASR